MQKVITGSLLAFLLIPLVASPLFAQEMMSGSMMTSTDLQVGAKGESVVSLQTFLEGEGYLKIPEGVAKGYFGMLTKNALASYQRAQGLPAFGFYGPLTRAKMNMNDKGVMVGGAPMLRSRDIVDNAVLASNVTTVVAAVKAAGLVDTLKSEGPFTVFAPTNTAFGKLPAGTVETLVKPENKATLVDILTYHVVAGRYTTAMLTDGLKLTTVEGKQLSFGRTASGAITINGVAMIETPNVISKNGVTHVIDGVLLPPEGVMVGGALMVKNLDIVENALNANNVKIVVSLVKAAGLVDTLRSEGPFTVFAPNDNAFAKLPQAAVLDLVKPENKTALAGVLTYHVVVGRYTSDMLTNGLKLKTVNGKELTFGRDASGKVTINGAVMIETPNVISKNGVTHVIDSVLLP